MEGPSHRQMQLAGNFGRHSDSDIAYVVTKRDLSKIMDQLQECMLNGWLSTYMLSGKQSSIPLINRGRKWTLSQTDDDVLETAVYRVLVNVELHKEDMYIVYIYIYFTNVLWRLIHYCREKEARST